MKGYLSNTRGFFTAESAEFYAEKVEGFAFDCAQATTRPFIERSRNEPEGSRFILPVHPFILKISVQTTSTGSNNKHGFEPKVND